MEDFEIFYIAFNHASLLVRFWIPTTLDHKKFTEKQLLPVFWDQGFHAIIKLWRDCVLLLDVPRRIHNDSLLLAMSSKNYNR